MTLIVPVLALIGIGIFELVTTSLDKPSTKKIEIIGFVDGAGIIKNQTRQTHIKMVPFATEDDATLALVKRETPEYIVIPADYTSTGKIRRYTLEKELGTPPVTAYMIKSFLTMNLLEDKLPQDMVSLIVAPLNLEVIRLNEKGGIAIEQGNIGNIIIPSIFSFLLSLALMFGAYSLISGLGEEKESRLIEVLFSSVSARQLLISKVLALGLAGLMQVMVWLISAPLLLSLASSSFGGIMSEIQIPGSFIILGIVYFLLGFSLFAVLSIGVSAISPTASEGGQLSLFYTLSSFTPLWFSSLLFAFPDSFIWVVLTIFPVTAPMQTMLRLGMSDIPSWQIFASIGVLVISIVLGLFLSIKIFRVYMLMYGKRPGLREIITSLKAA